MSFPFIRRWPFLWMCLVLGSNLNTRVHTRAHTYVDLTRSLARPSQTGILSAHCNNYPHNNTPIRSIHFGGCFIMRVCARSPPKRDASEELMRILLDRISAFGPSVFTSQRQSSPTSNAISLHVDGCVTGAHLYVCVCVHQQFRFNPIRFLCSLVRAYTIHRSFLCSTT